jgi:hypothetical protein
LYGRWVEKSNFSEADKEVQILTSGADLVIFGVSFKNYF